MITKQLAAVSILLSMAGCGARLSLPGALGKLANSTSRTPQSESPQRAPATTASAPSHAASPTPAGPSAWDRANAAIRKAQPFLERGTEPVPAEVTAALESALKDLADKPGTPYFQRQLDEIRQYDAWFAAQPGQALATTLGGKLLNEGTTPSRHVRLSFAAQPDWCYEVFARLKSPAELKAKLPRWSSNRGIDPLQRFEGAHALGRNVNGACTTSAVKVDFSLELDFPGTQNSVSYVVLGWPRAEMPVAALHGLRLDLGDPCNGKAMTELWANPVPGTLVYLGSEPYLLVKADDPPRTQAELLAASLFHSTSVSKDTLSREPKGEVRVSKQWEFRDCNLTRAEGRQSVRIAECKAATEKKWAAEDKKARAQWTAANSDVARYLAEEKMRDVEARIRADVFNKCNPLLEVAKHESQDTYRAIVDLLEKKKPLDSSQRVAQLKGEALPFLGR